MGIAYILERDLLDADATESEVEWLLHSLNVAGKIFISNVMAQHTWMEGQIKSDLLKLTHTETKLINI